jgi:hypothetical protein
MELIEMLKTRWWGLGWVLLLGVMIGVLYLAFRSTPSVQTDPITTTQPPQVTIITPPTLTTPVQTNPSIAIVQTNRALWESHGITHYKMLLSTLALPSPWVTREVIVEAGEIVQAELVPCPNVDAGACVSTGNEPMRYVAPSNVSRATIDVLFAQAETCTSQTIAALEQCEAFAPYTLTGFSNSDDMLAISRQCLGDEFDLNVMLCAVEYDPVYGFPMSILHYIPNAFDGAGVVVVDEFEILE